jgi:hypothetical protein
MAAMRLNDSAADRQSGASSVRLCGEECLENAFGLLYRKAEALVAANQIEQEFFDLRSRTDSRRRSFR